MESTAPNRSAQEVSPCLTRADQAVLLAVNRFHYLTAGQLGRLLYPGCQDDNRYSRRRLARLVDLGFLLRLRALPAPRFGSAPHVFTLARKGRRYLLHAGVEVPSHFRPSEEEDKAGNLLFMEHTLAAIDVLIAASVLCQSVPTVSLPRLLTERQLKQSALRVVVPARDGTGPGRATTVIPDGWFQLQVGERAPCSVAVELDRGSEDQKRWRQKATALAAWAVGPYREAFAASNLTIAVVTQSPVRRDRLVGWIREELSVRSFADILDIFLVTAASPVTAPPREFFFGQHWHTPAQSAPVALLDPLPAVGRDGQAALAAGSRFETVLYAPG